MSDKDEQYSPAEAERRSDDVLRHMLSRPPVTHAKDRPSQGRNQKKAEPKRKGRAPAKS